MTTSEPVDWAQLLNESVESMHFADYEEHNPEGLDTTTIEAALIEKMGVDVPRDLAFITGVLTGLRATLVVAGRDDWLMVPDSCGDPDCQDYHPRLMDMNMVSAIMLDNARALLALHTSLVGIDDLA